MDAENNPRLVVTAIFVILFLHVSFSLGVDTISANQSLSGDQTVISAAGFFELGFFTPGNSLNYYIGIWYREISPRTIVWVANREKPVSNRFSSVLRISDGNLVLFNESQTPIWSTNVKLTTNRGVKALLLNNGNLVLDDESNSSKPLWQSFDNPCHTFLHGTRFGYNSKMKSNQVLLTSWKNSEDPAPGHYSLELFSIRTELYLVLWNRSSSEISWSSGRWNRTFFSLILESNVLNFSYVSNDKESYFTYNAYYSSRYSRFMLDVLGQLKQLIWLPSEGWILFWAQPRIQCQVHAICGAYGICIQNVACPCSCFTGFEPNSPSDWNLTDYTSGCRRKTPLQCRHVDHDNGERDRFIKNPAMGLPTTEVSVRVRNTEECESTCLNDCSCTAYAYDTNNCLIWTGDLLNLQQLEPKDSSGKTLYVRVAASGVSSHKIKNRVSIGVVVGSAVGFSAFLGVIVFGILWQRKNTVVTGKTVEGSLAAFDYRYLQNATNNFSEKLGGGGFGSVFKGTLPDSTLIAVKKLESFCQGEKQFRTEVSTIGIIQHVNLVRLRGFCSQGTKKLLVYDYMPNGSLDFHLFHRESSNVLNWKIRYEIALGTARGLLYLHEKCRDCIIHCDIKPDNVLLDGEFCPKLADFGLAKLVGRDFSRVLTTMRGTRGYLAPEWISGAAITTKADVYSYGMMLFEFVSGRRNSSHYVEGEESFFPSCAASVIIEGGDVFSLLDPRLEGKADEEELTRLCRVACWCIQGDEAHRPSMGSVVQILEGIINVNLPPFPRLFQFFVANPDDNIFCTESSSCSESQSRMSIVSSPAKNTYSSDSSPKKIPIFK